MPGEHFYLSSDASIVGIEDGRSIRIEDRRNGTSCSIQWPSKRQDLYLGGFIHDERLLVTIDDPSDLAKRETRYELYDRNCESKDSWTLLGGTPATASPQKEHLFVLRYSGGTQWETDLVEWPAWKVVNRWPYWKPGLAADNGHAICIASFGGNGDDSPLQCRDLTNGALLARGVVIHDGDPFAVATSGTLVVATDWFEMWKPFTEGDYWIHVKRQVLWDFRSGQVLASWTPELQRDNAGKWKGGSFSMHPIQRVPFICALSHSGTFLLEGGDDSIRISRILAH